MAKFTGTVQEFHHFIGPRIRNIINNSTRQARNERNGICEHCNAQSVLQSAHIHGRGRRTIIEEVLAPCLDSGVAMCDLEQIEAKILAAHEPIEDTFLFLCQSCHTKYDSHPSARKNDQRSLGEGDQEFSKISRIALWARRPDQDNHKIIRAFLHLEENGTVEFEVIKKYCAEQFEITGFDGHYAAMKSDKGNSHGKVFFNDGSNVKMWPVVRKEVDKYFQ